jgi:hypothetical protein
VTLTDAIGQVITARTQYYRLRAQVQALREAWTQQHAAVLQEAARCQAALEQAEATLRQLAVERYQATSQKILAPGVKVRERIRLTYDPQTALTWATAHRLALRLDVTAFEQLARVTPLAFVRRQTEPQATLSPCLPGEQDDITTIHKETDPWNTQNSSSTAAPSA